MLSISHGNCVETEFEIKKSRFITQVYRVDSLAQAREKIALAKKQYPDARHHCTAFSVFEENIEILRSNDDGEPSGTAGQPMLAALKGSELKNVVFIAIRYFGGIKLGTGGLVSAYTQSVHDGVKACFRENRVVEIVNTKTYLLEIDMSSYGKISADIYNNNLKIENTFFENDKVKFILSITDGNLEYVNNTLSSLLQTNISLEEHGVCVTEIPVES
ncbi:YigZ family protein [Actinomyces sp. zg-332]|uniref:IMPACT family protein n=1 Tax=Actinomyces sp. zg-332 TaxID=2708340 RepID=UPI00141EFD19|nr:YigZ family protein [Actinomyces sp. zg-332]QPK94545.1 YigZ family protein [Actinomyces sp. zg-332]